MKRPSVDLDRFVVGGRQQPIVRRQFAERCRRGAEGEGMLAWLAGIRVPEFLVSRGSSRRGENASGHRDGVSTSDMLCYV